MENKEQVFAALEVELDEIFAEMEADNSRCRGVNLRSRI